MLVQNTAQMSLSLIQDTKGRMTEEQVGQTVHQNSAGGVNTEGGEVCDREEIHGSDVS